MKKRNISKNFIDIKNFNIEDYQELLDNLGLEDTWNTILGFLFDKTVNDLKVNKLFDFDNLGELYEIGLAYTNKIAKKDMGKYYTPIDVSVVMAELLLENKIDKIADVACGTGNLIIEVLKLLKVKKGIDPITFIKERKLYLYDFDKLALKICIKKIEILLGENLEDYINVVAGDFLDSKIQLPAGISVITNPPYSIIKKFKKSWNVDDIALQAKDLYASFMNKIINYCNNAIIVSPQSYLVADKFSKLRKKMSDNFSGEIFSFDNVPGTLFNGKKHGLFNTNSANGVRASITSIRRNGQIGFKLTHLIRFRTDQREDIIDLSFLRLKLGDIIQDLERPIKAFKELEPMLHEIKDQKKLCIADLLEFDINKQKKIYRLYISTSARYFIVASTKSLKRKGYFIVYAKDKECFELLYSFLNSSYVYMWWRFLDGGILFTKKILYSIPYNAELFNKINSVEDIIAKMISKEDDYVTYKVNAGEKQESIKFPEEYRNIINEVLFPKYAEDMKLLHKNYEVSHEK